MQKNRHILYTPNLTQIMRISFMLWCFLFTAGLVLANHEKSFGQKELEKTINVNFRNISLREALEQLQTKHQIPLAYSNEENYLSSRINYSGNKPAKKILEELLKSQNMTYELRHDFVRLVKSSPSVKNESKQQQRDVTGTVKSKDGEPLAGVSVSLKERPTIGTTTDIYGKFILTVPAQSTLVFQIVGYKSMEVSVQKQSSLNVIMDLTEAGIDEVVVVGFGTQKKISVIGSQSTVEPKNLQVPVANLTNALAGRMAGVVSVQRTGEPGFDDAGIWIRGISTFSSSLSEPLVLVDGTPRKMSNVDPEDIESFTILKDAAATAVYGVRGANGVIIVKTKSGVAGKPKFSFRYYEGLTQFTKLPEFADGITYMRMSNEAQTNMQLPILYTDQIEKTISGEDPYLYPNVDWVDALFNKFGHQRRGNLNISGGSDRANYYVGTSYFDEVGLYKQDELVKYNQQVGYKRYNLTSNLTVKASNLAKVELGVQGYLANANYPAIGQRDIFDDLYMVTPVLHPIMYENGNVPDQRAGSLVNPYAQLTQTGYANQWRNQLFSNIRATHELPFITKGLSATAMFSFDVYNYTSMRRTKRPDAFLAIGRNADGEMQYEQTWVGERFLNFNRNSTGERTIYVEGALNYNREFGKHATTGMLLFNKSDKLDSQAGNLINSLPYRYLGLSGRATYSYDNRYFAEANFGYNGSENFTPKRQYGFFPSFGIAWVLSEEKFFESLKDQFSLAKIRFSHGKSGSSSVMIGETDYRFAYISTIKTTTGYNFGKSRGNDFKDGYNIDEYGVDVTWETSVKSNLGLDLQTRNNALNIQLDIFKEQRTGIFLRRASVPSYVGAQTLPKGNLGAIDNKGIDGSITWNKRFNDFSLQLLANATYNRNKVIENDQPDPLYPWLNEKGMKVGRRLGLVALGLFESEEEIANGPLHTGTVQRGDIRFQDTNGDGKIDDFDRVPIGHGTIPEFVYGFGLSFSYKNWSISSLFQGVGNVDIMMNGEGLMPFSVSLSRGNLLTNIEDRWTEENPRQDAFYPRLSVGSPNSNFVNSTWWLKNGRYMRLKDLQLTYQLPKSISQKARLTNANIFFAGYNLLTWSPFKFWDVELGDGRGTRYPNLKTYSLGLNVNF